MPKFGKGVRGGRAAVVDGVWGLTPHLDEADEDVSLAALDAQATVQQLAAVHDRRALCRPHSPAALRGCDRLGASPVLLIESLAHKVEEGAAAYELSLRVGEQ